MSYRFYTSGSTVTFGSGSFYPTPSGSYYSSSNTDNPTSSGYFSGSSAQFHYLDMTQSGSASQGGPWTGSLTPFTESGANSHGIPVGSASFFTSSWAYGNGTHPYGTTASAFAGDPYGATRGYIEYTTSVVLLASDEGDFSIAQSTSYGSPNNRTHFYASGSGKIGIGTSSPTDDIDLKADTIKFRSVDGTEEMEFSGGAMRTKKYQNIAEGEEAAAEVSGSELVMAYSPGTFAEPSTASVGDVLGTITWEDLSIAETGPREDATAMRIRGVVNGVASDASAIKGSMNFGIGSSQAGQPISDHLVISTNDVTVTESNMTITGQRLTLGNSADDDSDKYVSFITKTTSKRWVAGVDISLDAFIIDKNTSANIPASGQDFIFYGGGGLSIAGNLTCLKVQSGQGATEVHLMNQNIQTSDDVVFAKVTTTSMPGFTGSTIPIDGGVF